MAESVLHVENVTMQFGGVVAVNNLSMDIYEGEIVALIGPTASRASMSPRTARSSSAARRSSKITRRAR